MGCSEASDDRSVGRHHGTGRTAAPALGHAADTQAAAQEWCASRRLIGRRTSRRSPGTANLSSVFDELAEGLGRLVINVLKVLGRLLLELVGEAVIEAITDRWSRWRATRAARRAG